MKCPKCGFTSFDYLDSCRKCGVDLAEHKRKFGIASLLFPVSGATAEGTDQPEEPATAEEALQVTPQDATDFGFDFLAAKGDEDRSQAPLVEEMASTEDPAVPEPPPNLAASPPEDDDLDGLPDLDGEDEFSFDDFELDPADLDFSTEEKVLAGHGADEAPGPDAQRPPSDQSKEPFDPFDQRESAAARQTPEIIDGRSLAPAAPASPAGQVAAAEKTPPAPAGEAEKPLLLEELVLPEDAAETVEKTEVRPAMAVASPLPGERSASPAPLVTRLAASLADLLLLGALFACFLLVAQRLLQPGGLWLPRLELLLSGPCFLLFFAIGFGYFTVFHLLLGQTPGKMLFGLGVETADGALPSAAQAFLRSVGGLASACCGGLGFLPVLFDGRGRGWNDRLAGTQVVWWPAAPASAQEISAEEPP